MNKKRLITGFFIKLIFLTFTALPISAAPQIMAGGTVFDPVYYMDNNPDVVTAFGTDINLLYRHYIKYGISENRKPHADFYIAPVTKNATANPYSYLNLPSYITKIGSLYFIVDCYNNQVIYSNSLHKPISTWSVMTSDVTGAHTIASDGIVYLIDDTESHRILVMEKRVNTNGQPVFIKTQEFNEIGKRPHYVSYNEAKKAFYAWSSYTGEMFIFKRNPDNSVYLSDIRTIPQLTGGVYTRSFTIIGNDIYFVSGNSSIIKSDLSSFRVINEYPVPPHLAGMVQMTKIEDYYYITISTDIHGNQNYATIIRTKDLSTLKNSEYEDIYLYFIGGGTPYNITNIDGRWYLTEHRAAGRNIWSFSVIDNTITDVRLVY